MNMTTRDRLADIGLFLLAAGFVLITADPVLQGADLPHHQLVADQITAALACAALFLRRRWPVQLAVVLLVIGMVSHLVTGPIMVAMFTVAAGSRPRTTGWVVLLAAAPAVTLLFGRDDRQDTALAYFAFLAASVGWGLYVRSRRQFLISLQEQARRQARADMAREMHDVLAHRLSLLSVHAGALEFNPAAPAAEIRQAAGVIRDSAHQALEDLRKIIGVLRTPGDSGRPQPVLTDLDRLVEESRTAGMRVTLHQHVAEPAPEIAGRTAYRIVQEGLTNARKHAPDAEVTVTVRGGPGEGLTVRVHNRTAGAPAAIPGAGLGLIGLAERAELAGGRLAYGRSGDDFHLDLELPWPA
jgi:signal transduction histidine kinase